MSARRGSGILRAAGVSAAGTLFSRVLGALRDVALGHVLGAGASSDAFFVAFTIPNVFRRFVADEGLTGALVPAVARTEREEGAEAARRLAGRTLTALLAAGALLALAGIAFAPALAAAFAPGFLDDPERMATTVALTRILAPFVVFVSLVSWAEGLINHRGHFFVPKLAPGLVSAAIVVAALLARDSAHPETAVAWGVLVGGAVHLAACLPPLLRLWGPVPPVLRGLADPRFIAFLREMGKVVLIGIFAQVNILVLRQLASLLAEGAVTWYWYANRVVDLAQGVVAVAVGSAVLPAVSRAAADRDWSSFAARLSEGLRLVNLVLLPGAAMLLALAPAAVSVLFLHGRFDAHSAERTAATLRAMVPFMLAAGNINVVKRAYFALDRRGTLLAVGGLGVALTGGLGWLLVGTHGVVGLAAALSASALVQLAAYVALLARAPRGRVPAGPLLAPLGRMALAALPAGAAAAAVAALGEWARGPLALRNWLALAGALAAGGAAFLAAARLLRVPEVDDLRTRIAARLRR